MSPWSALAYARVVKAVVSASSAFDFDTRSNPAGERHSAPSAFGRQHSASPDGAGAFSSDSHASRNVRGTPCESSFG